jgi:peptidoglycan/LPS O-acetylase OafA/YrhL
MIAVFTHGLNFTPEYRRHALVSLFYLHNLSYGTPSWINPITWSLEVEIQFYLLAPLVMQMFRITGRTRRRALMAVCILALGLAQIPLAGSARFNLSVLYYMQYFLAGLVLADVFVLDLQTMRSSWLWDVAGLTGLGFMFGVGHDVYAAHVLLPIALGTVCLASMRSLVLRRVAANPWIAVTGGMCYSIYLLHFALMATLFKATRRVIVPQFDFLANYAIQLVIMGVPILLTSALFYMLVERPCMDPDWPSKLWHKVTGRSGDDVEAFDTAGISEGKSQG